MRPIAAYSRQSVIVNLRLVLVESIRLALVYVQHFLHTLNHNQHDRLHNDRYLACEYRRRRRLNAKIFALCRLDPPKNEIVSYTISYTPYTFRFHFSGHAAMVLGSMRMFTFSHFILTALYSSAWLQQQQRNPPYTDIFHSFISFHSIVIYFVYFTHLVAEQQQKKEEKMLVKRKSNFLLICNATNRIHKFTIFFNFKRHTSIWERRNEMK